MESKSDGYKELEKPELPFDNIQKPQIHKPSKKEKLDTQDSIISKIDLLFNNLSVDLRYDIISLHTLIILDWYTLRLNTNIDDLLQVYDIPNVLLKLIKDSNSPVVILALRITNFLCRNSMKLLSFMLDNLPSFIHLIRAPQFFPLICELIDGFCKYFADAPEKIEQETNIIHMLSQLTSSMPPNYISIVCYLISQILSHVMPCNIEDFEDKVKEPLCIVARGLKSFDPMIVSQMNMTFMLSSLLNLFGSILHIYCGDFQEIVDEEIFSKLVDITLSWDSIDSTGAIYGDALRLWNIIINEFTDFFVNSGVKDQLIEMMVHTFKHSNCPRARVLFTMSNLAYFDELTGAVVKSRILEKAWKRIDTFSNHERELLIYLFLNCCIVSPNFVLEVPVFNDLLLEAFDAVGSSTPFDYEEFFIKGIDRLLQINEDAVTSLIDREDAEATFNEIAQSENEEVASIAQHILAVCFTEE